MTLKEKVLIVWILGSMAIALLASYAQQLLVAGLESACAFVFVPAVIVKVAAAFFSCTNS